MTGDVRQSNIGIVSLPTMPIAAAQPGRLDPDHHTVLVGSWFVDSDNLGCDSKSFDQHSTHEWVPSVADATRIGWAAPAGLAFVKWRMLNDGAGPRHRDRKYSIGRGGLSYGEGIAAHRFTARLLPRR
jgi:hypothetical protein